MGNCIRHEQSSWVDDEDDDDDDWGSSVRQGDDHGGKRDANTREIKITISKKELQQLVQKVDMQGLTLEQVLARMVMGGEDVYKVEQHQPWKPVLQSIPEVN